MQIIQMNTETLIYFCNFICSLIKNSSLVIFEISIPHTGLTFRIDYCLWGIRIVQKKLKNNWLSRVFILGLLFIGGPSILYRNYLLNLTLWAIINPNYAIVSKSL